MTRFLLAAGYLIVLGFAAFWIGRILPKGWFNPDAFPYRDWAFEQKGNLYRRIHIHRWQSHVPDMSRIFRHAMPAKRLSTDISSGQVDLMIRETCVAEFTHLALIVLSLPVFWICPGPAGIALYLLDLALGNGVFILVQRFNRPKLKQLRDKLRRRGL